MEDTRRINKLHGILLEDVRVQGLVEQASKGGFEVVDELPTENIKERTIYSVRKIDYYTSLYGTKMPTLMATNRDDWNANANKILKAKGLTISQVGDCTTMLTMGAFAVQTYNADDEISKNIFENNVFSYELTQTIDGEKKSIIYTAKTIAELYEYLFSDEWAEKVAELYDIGLEELQTIRDTLKSLNFKYQTTPLTADEIGAVFEETYDYYIYTGKDWVGVGNDVVVKEIDATRFNNLNGVAFTNEEIDKLWNGAQLIIKPILDSTAAMGQIMMYCHLTQKLDFSSEGEELKLLYYRVGSDFTLDDYETVQNISFGIGNQGSDKIYTIFAFDVSRPAKINTNVSIVWEEDTTYKTLGYNYKGAVQGYSGDTAIITFSPEDAASGNFSTFGTGGGADTNYIYYVYAKSLPDHTVTVNITVL